MDDKRFDELAKRVGASRRSVLKKMIGLGGAVAVARLSVSEAEAARRGFGGPSVQPPNDDYRYCALSGGCCIECSLSFWVSKSALTKRINTCLAEHNTCWDCADTALSGSGLDGTCWVA